ncbi:MAG: 1-acyl-sn-glycerol-3-phosphate acyltransferase [Treponema sp.]|jgi:1-acyl-sn-glycerol-3-phosphate acyltransferase|nr:1-acyl-sn-glycerol-3-phosphate acyltransferase [Treponema sp.]
MAYYLKIVFLTAALLLHAALAAVGKILFIFSRRLCILYLANINKIVCALFCVILGISIRGPKKRYVQKNPVLYVGNHLSYLDVLAIGRCYPTIFVTSVDMGERKNEGWITSNAGSVYVERRREKLTFNILRKNIESMKEIILKDCPLCIFPEATSANGEKELIFFSSLFSSVEYTETTIVPFVIKYISINKENVTKENESIVYFYRGQRFIPHIKRLLHYKNIKIEISILPWFSAKNKNRKEICDTCKKKIAGKIMNKNASGFA